MSVIQGIYVALFGRPADPGGLAYWTEVTKDGADLSAMLDVLPSLPEYQSRFEGMSNTQVVTAIYQALFGREPDAEGLAFFVGQLQSGAQSIATIAVHILNGAQGTDKETIDAKVAAADLFTASLDTEEEIAAYNADAIDAARAFLNGVDKDHPATQDSVDQAINEIVNPDEGQAPGGGGGGVTPPPGPAATLVDGKISVADGTTVTITETGDSIVVARTGFATSTFAKGDVTEIALGANATANLVAGGDFTNFTGTGSLNVTGVSFTGATKDASAANSLDASPSLLDLIGALGNGDIKLSVNGSEADTITALWDFWDAGYVANFPETYTDFEINSATINLGLRYLEYLENDGPALTGIIAKGGGGREQTLHDNLLGNLTYASVTDRGFDDDVEAEFLAAIPPGIQGRPWVSGYAADVGNTAHDLARAYDYIQGWDRPDWIDTVRDGVVDVAGQETPNRLFFGGGNTADGFNIVRHEGAGVELALKVKVRGGTDYDAVIVDDVAVYSVATGTQDTGWGGPNSAASWNFDFSVVTGLNGNATDLSSYTFVISIDTDAGEGVSLVDFTFNPDHLTGVWLGGAGGFGGDDRGNTQVEQNSVNFGYQAILDILEGYTLGGVGNFDIQLAAYDGTDLMGINKIRVIAEDILPA